MWVCMSVCVSYSEANQYGTWSGLRGTPHACLIWAPMTTCDGDLWVMIKNVGQPMESEALQHIAG